MKNTSTTRIMMLIILDHLEFLRTILVNTQSCSGIVFEIIPDDLEIFVPQNQELW